MGDNSSPGESTQDKQGMLLVHPLWSQALSLWGWAGRQDFPKIP